MKERPILFKGEMVRAIIDGRKTQTRRVVKPQPEPIPADVPYARGDDGYWWASTKAQGMLQIREMARMSPYGKRGDQLWVRETFAPRYFDNGSSAYRSLWDGAAADLCEEPRWKPSIHMPRSASCIDLKIDDVRVERLQDISEGDAMKEGAASFRRRFPDMPDQRLTTGEVAFASPYRSGFAVLWDEINAARGYSWKLNPWVWVVDFRVIQLRYTHSLVRNL